tara:strand:- start:125 stop:412 length:288 start_codon:yes stop_codon:yes gene_type:complete
MNIQSRNDMMIHMKSTNPIAASIVKSSGNEEFVVGDIVQWTHDHKGRGVIAYGEVSGIMRKNMWVSLLGKEWKVNIQEASLIHRIQPTSETEGSK